MRAAAGYELQPLVRSPAFPATVDWIRREHWLLGALTITELGLSK